MSITAVVENDTIKLPPGVHLPDGTRVEIVTPAEPQAGAPDAGALTDALLAISQKVQGLPSDLAAQHDHYIHGQPKR